MNAMNKPSEDDNGAQRAAGCCGGPAPQGPGYATEDANSVPAGANMGLGWGNPQAIANFKCGETVRDLGSGGGSDGFFAARQVGDTGRVIGVDMTPEMLAKTRDNAQKGGYLNVEFCPGEIDNLPLPNVTVDVIIANCVINLSPDKPAAFVEAFCVLSAGGRPAVSDVVAFAALPADLQRDMALYTDCMAGASVLAEVQAMLRAAGFEQVRVVPKDKSKLFIRDWAPGTPITDYVMSANIQAIKPANPPA